MRSEPGCWALSRRCLQAIGVEQARLCTPSTVLCFLSHCVAVAHRRRGRAPHFVAFVSRSSHSCVARRISLSSFVSFLCVLCLLLSLYCACCDVGCGGGGRRCEWRERNCEFQLRLARLCSRSLEFLGDDATTCSTIAWWDQEFESSVGSSRPCCCRESVGGS